MKIPRGFSLIELMVTITLLAFLVLAALPLTEGWIKEAQLEKDTAVFKLGFTQAKAAAMRNAHGIFNGGAAVALCRVNSELKLYLPPETTPATTPKTYAPARCPTGTNVDEPIWKSAFGEGVTIQYGNNNPVEFCSAVIDSKGVIHLCPAATTGGCSSTCTELNGAANNQGITLSVQGVEHGKPVTVF